MVDPIGEAEPPDDSGADTFGRFRYQAHVAFRWCLRLYFGLGPRKIVAEHFEDLLVESDEELRFVQVKTRDAELGPWRFRYLVESGGALHGLLRTHRALASMNDPRRVVYDIRLEGPAQRGDALLEVRPGGGSPSDQMVEECVNRLQCEEAVARTLLEKLEVHSGEPPRSLIEARNMADLGRAASHRTARQLSEIYQAVIGLIEEAMAVELVGEDWPKAIVEPASAQEAARQRVEAKTIDHNKVASIMRPLDASDRAVLEEITDPDRLRATALERKMTAQGMPELLIREAKKLRAQASHRLIEFQNSSLTPPDALLEDLEIRLLTIARTTAAGRTDQQDGAAIWHAIHQRVESSPVNHDPRGILHQEPLLLMGAICQYSDECRFAWSSNG